VVQDAAARPVPVFGDPVKNPPSVTHLNNVARDVYFSAQLQDPWPGGEYPGASPQYVGTSVLAGVKVGQTLGWWSQYRWALGPGPEAAAQDVILTLGYLGPVIMGSFWYDGMWDADSKGYLNAVGRIDGGHCYLLTRYSLTRDAVWTGNSWGGAGAGWIRRADLVTLLGNDGEACIPVGRKM
jgi:hypothetical protein